MSEQQHGIMDELPEPGVFSGVCTLVGGLLALGVVGLIYVYGPADNAVVSHHLAIVIPLSLLFAFLVAAFTFLIGWIVEAVWPLLLMLIFVGLVLCLPLVFYFGPETLFEMVNGAMLGGMGY